MARNQHLADSFMEQPKREYKGIVMIKKSHDNSDLSVTVSTKDVSAQLNRSCTSRYSVDQ